MFNLIITIISIALVVAMAAAAVYYGGSAFTQGTAKANAATLVTQAQQINGAITLYKNDNGGTAPLVMADLVDDYLQNAPVPGSAGADGSPGWVLSADSNTTFATVTVKGAEVCTQINVASGHDGASTSVDDAVYGCETATLKMTYKN